MQLAPRWKLQATSVDDTQSLRSAALNLARTAFGCAFSAHVSDVLAATLTSALFDPVLPMYETTAAAQLTPEPLELVLELARLRAAGSLSLACAGGLSVQASNACGGMLLRGAPMSDEMPRALRAAGKLACVCLSVCLSVCGDGKWR